MVSIILIMMVIYFIKEQFEFNTVTKTMYYFLPLFSLFQALLSFKTTNKNILVLLLCIIISVFVGFYQAKHAKIREHLKPMYTYFSENNEKKHIYKQEVAVKGGSSYLIGWILIFVIQLLMQFYVTSSRIELSSSLYKELLEDLFVVYRLQGFEEDKQNWFAWSLYGFSSLFYLLFLCKRNIRVKEVLFRTEKIIEE